MMELKSMSERRRKWIELRFKWDMFWNRIFRIKLSSRPSRYLLHVFNDQESVYSNSFDYNLSLYGFKRCDCCNGFGFQKK